MTLPFVTATTIGTGVGVVAGPAGNSQNIVLAFKSLVPGPGISIVPDSSNSIITISNNTGSVAQLLSLTTIGDINGTTTYDAGTNAGTLTLTMPSSGVTAGTYNGLSINAKGLITSARSLSSTDVATALGYTPASAAFAASVAAALSPTGVTAGTYSGSTVVVNVDGRITAASNDPQTIEYYGGVGDGVTDNTTAFDVLIASTAPFCKLGPHTYVINGALNFSNPITLVGVPGVTKLLCGGVVSAAQWIEFSANATLDGITFDMNSENSGRNAWGVLVSNTVTSFSATRCNFTNSVGTLGYGLAIVGNPSGATSYMVSKSTFYANAVDGLYAEQITNGDFSDNTSYGNGGNGFSLQLFSSPSSSNLNQRVSISKNKAYGNSLNGIQTVGFVIGTYDGHNLYGFDPTANFGISVNHNMCWDNTLYEIACYGDLFEISENIAKRTATGTTTKSMMDFAVRYSRIESNSIVGYGCAFGLDCGGSSYTDVRGNQVSGSTNGINCGGSTALTVAHNSLYDVHFNIVATNIEADGNLVGFPSPTTDLVIEYNKIAINGTGIFGVLIYDNAQGVARYNNFIGNGGAAPQSAFLMQTGSFEIYGNTWNGSNRLTTNPNGSGILDCPDVYDVIRLTNTNVVVNSAVPTTMGIFPTGGVAWINMTTTGSGYTKEHTTAALLDTSLSGTSAALQPIIYNGAIIGIRVVATGSAYNISDTSVVITGDGTGAAATPQIGMVLPPNRMLQVQAQNGATIVRNGTQTVQLNTTNHDLVLSVGAGVALHESYNQWFVTNFWPDHLIQQDYSSNITINGTSLTVPALSISAGATGTGFVLDVLGNITAQAFTNQGAMADASVVGLVPLTGGSHVIPNNTSWFSMSPAGTIATYTLTMPAAPVANQDLWIDTTQQITGLTLLANFGQTINGAPTTMAANSSVHYRFNGGYWRRMN